MEPKVTGLSPMTGPPGTKITVRGDNLGQSSNDIIKLTINGADCLPYLEWKSPKKIITRCTKALGSGDVIITTDSGGVGTCDVQFNCHEQVVGPTDESAVWVEEIDYQIAEKEKHTLTGSSSVIDEYSLEISSTRFKPQHYLKHNHSEASLSELEQLHRTLKADLNNKSNPEAVSSSSNRAALLKSNLPVIMECLQILEHLSKVITTSRDTSVDSIAKSIKESLSKTHGLFDPLLEQKDLVQRIENEVQVFRQNETLFNLPLAIENSIKTKNYDSVMKEIAGVFTRLKTINIEKSRAEKIQRDVTTKVEELKAAIEGQLHQTCTNTSGQRNIDEVKKLIGHLNCLGQPVNYDVWVGLKEMSAALISSLTKTSDHFRELSLNSIEVCDERRESKDSTTKKDPPPVVQFVQNALSIFHNTYYDILALGQSYFDPKDEFACRESEELKQARQMEYDKEMVAKPIRHLCILLRLALVPDSSKLDKPSPWPSSATENYADWIRHVLQSVINCHINLTKVNLPLTVRATLEDFKEFVIDLRVKSMEILFGSATRLNKNLHHEEDWVVDVDDVHGGITKLPYTFEKNVIDTLRFADETIFKTNLPDEKSILEGYNVQASMKGLTQSLINSFIDSLDNALNDTKEHPAESTRALVACRDSKRAPSKHMNRLIVTICNCQYTKSHVFLRLEDEFKKLPGLTTVKVFEVCSEKYSQYINKLSERFCNIKYAELSKGLDMLRHSHIESLQISLMILNAQIFLIAPQLVNNLMTSIVNKIQEAQTSVQSRI